MSRINIIFDNSTSTTNLKCRSFNYNEQNFDIFLRNYKIKSLKNNI